MYCEECGNKLKKDVKFCTTCGHPVDANNVEVTPVNVVNKENNNYLTASIILGIITMVLAFILTGVVIPLGIVGLVLGVLAYNKNKKVVGIILNIIGIILALVLSMIYVILFVLFASYFDNGYDYDYEYDYDYNYEYDDYFDNTKAKINQYNSFNIDNYEYKIYFKD